MTPLAATSSLPAYFPVVMLFLAALGFALFNVILSQLLGRPRPRRHDLQPGQSQRGSNSTEKSAAFDARGHEGK